MKQQELTYEQFIEAIRNLHYISNGPSQVSLYGRKAVERHNSAVDALRKEYIVDNDEESYYPFRPEKHVENRPTKDDADDEGLVQYLYEDVWNAGPWEIVAKNNWPWCHTPRWEKSPKSIVKRLEECPRTCLEQKITYHVPKELVDAVREWCGLE
jgi:hypothetical protein